MIESKKKSRKILDFNDKEIWGHYAKEGLDKRLTGEWMNQWMNDWVTESHGRVLGRKINGTIKLVFHLIDSDSWLEGVS